MGGFGGHITPLCVWNLAPIPGTDLSRSLVAVGHDFSFPVVFLASKHFELTSSPESIKSFARTQAELLSASQRFFLRSIILTTIASLPTRVIESLVSTKKAVLFLPIALSALMPVVAELGRLCTLQEDPGT